LERHVLKSSCLTSSEMGIGVLIFSISCSKMKEEGGFRISLTSGTRLLTIGGGGLCLLFIASVYNIFSEFLCSRRRIRDVQFPFFLFGTQIIYVWSVGGFFPFTQLI
jgi:hypothetical protein